MINELKILGYESKNGGIVYEAPQGYHDDWVIALAPAWWFLKEMTSGKPLLVRGP